MCFWQSIWNILKEILSAIGPLLAALLAIWLKEWYDSKRHSRDWFFNRYIQNGISPLLAYIDLLQPALAGLKEDFSEIHFKKIEYPEDALAIMHDLLQSSIFQNHFSLLSATYDDMSKKIKLRESENSKSTAIAEIVESTGHIIVLKDFLLKLREILLNQPIKSYRDAYKIAHLDSVQRLIEEVENDLKTTLTPINKQTSSGKNSE